MGKRELLIICAFVVVGAIAYQVTAPPAKPGERRFSIANIFNNVKKEIRANSSSASIKKTGTIPLRSGVTELRVATGRSVPLTVIGEKRDDVGYEMPVESTGPDEATAREWANRVDVRQDDLGAALSLNTYFPEEGTQNATLTLHVPARMAVRVENSGKIGVSRVAAVELRNPAGEVSLSDIGTITGSHRSGELTVNAADTVNLTLSSSRAKIHNIKQDISITARSGECWIAESPAKVTAIVTNVELVINAFKNAIKVSGDGGQVKVLDPMSLSIDARRMLVEIETSGAPGTGDEITIITSEEPLKVWLGGDPSYAIDAVSSGGKIRSVDFDLKPTVDPREARLNTTFGKGGARMVLRNSRGDIVIGKRK